MRLTASIFVTCFALCLAAGQENPVSLDTPFNHLKVTGNIHIELVSSDTQKLTIVSDENQDALDIETIEDRLVLKTKSELSKSPSIDVKLQYVNLSSLEIKKGGRVQSGDVLKTKLLQLDVLTGGKIELTIQVDSISARINQGADIILYGSTRSQFINAYTWGNYLAYDLKAENSYVKAATGAQVKVNAYSILDANATSKAFVGYRGEPDQKRIKTSVGGEVTPMSE